MDTSARSASTPSGPVISTYGGTPVAGAGTVTGASLPRPADTSVEGHPGAGEDLEPQQRQPRLHQLGRQLQVGGQLVQAQPEVDPLLELGVLVPGPRMTLGDGRAG